MGRKESWNEFLDEEDVMFTRLVCTEDFKKIEEFAVVYYAIRNDVTYEIIRYDCSKDEEVNVHQFFKKPAVKRYLNKDKSWDTLYEAIMDIRRNWRIYRSEYFR